jgi:hypothetical protein
MGINTEIRELLKQHFPAAFRGPSTDDSKGVVLIKDVLTHVHQFRGKSGFAKEGVGRLEYQFTGLEFCAEFCETFVSTARTGYYKAVVLCMDVQERVPPEKGEEQAARDAARGDRSGLPPADAELGFDGINGRRFDLRTLVRVRPLRNKLWELLLKYISKNAVLFSFVPIILDFSVKGPVFVFRGRIGLIPDAMHDLGEADLTCTYWASRFPDTTVIIQSTDSDYLPICVAYVQCTPRKGDLFVHYGDKADDIMNMKQVAAAIDAQWDFDMFKFMLACVLSGTDYTKRVKQDVLPRVGVRHLLYGLQFVSAQTALGVMSEETHEAMSAVREIVRAILSCSLGDTSELTADEVREIIRRKNLTQVRYPSEEDIGKALKAIRFNLAYWTRDWEACKTKLPKEVLEIV